jgi:glycosyltransferase involved in cell wall biosynthesis
MVGRLVPEKAPLILIQAVDQLVRSGVRVDLRFVGSGMLEERLRMEVRDRGLDQYVTWLGRSASTRFLPGTSGPTSLPPEFPRGPSRRPHGGDGHGAARRDDPHCRDR